MVKTKKMPEGKVADFMASERVQDLLQRRQDLIRRIQELDRPKRRKAAKAAKVAGPCCDKCGYQENGMPCTDYAHGCEFTPKEGTIKK